MRHTVTTWLKRFCCLLVLSTSALAKPSTNPLTHAIHRELPTMVVYIPTQSDLKSLMGDRELNLQHLKINKKNQSYTLQFSLTPRCNGSSSCSNGKLTVGLNTNDMPPDGKPVFILLDNQKIPANLSQRGTFGQFYHLDWKYHHQYFTLQTKSNTILSVARRLLQPKSKWNDPK